MNFTRKILEDALLNALSNAEELYQEAVILKDNKRYARAYTLFHLSIEEIGKVFIIYKYLLGNDYSDDQMKEFEKEFKQHKVKIDFATNIDVLANWVNEGGLTAEILEKATYSKKQIDDLNDLKNLSLYSFFHKGSSFKPSDMIEDKDVEQIHFIAEYRIKGTSDLSKVFLPDLDRLIKVIEEHKSK